MGFQVSIEYLSKLRDKLHLLELSTLLILIYQLNYLIFYEENVFMRLKCLTFLRTTFNNKRLISNFVLFLVCIRLEHCVFPLIYTIDSRPAQFVNFRFWLRYHRRCISLSHLWFSICLQNIGAVLPRHCQYLLLHWVRKFILLVLKHNWGLA